MNIAMSIHPYFGRMTAPKPVSAPQFGLELRERAVDLLLMDPKYIPLIQSGQKTSTVRLGNTLITKSRITIIPNNDPNNPRKQFEVALKGLELKEYSELTDAHAKMDGFSSLRELQQALKQYYGNIPENYPMTIIHFKYNA